MYNEYTVNLTFHLMKKIINFIIYCVNLISYYKTGSRQLFVKINKINKLILL